MNCKPGDLAVIVWTMRRENCGAIVRVVRRFSPADSAHCLPENGLLYYSPGDSVAWVVESCGRPLVNSSASSHKVSVHFDCCLRPLRDSDGTDEMIRIAGLPNKEYA